MTKFENIKFIYKPGGIYVFPQVSKNAARAKFRRMQQGAGFCKNKYFRIGFADWRLVENENAIECSTSYHSEYTVLKMYFTNCKDY